MDIPFKIRTIKPEDNLAIANIIREVMPEFGAFGPGFAINDPEVNDMYTAYSKPRCTYYVVTLNDKILGGAGIAPLQNSDEDTCELQKMYFLPTARGLGLGQQMLELCIKKAQELGFKRCYVETLKTMTQAQKLYVKNGFHPLIAPLGNTGHFGCDTWLEKEI